MDEMWLEIINCKIKLGCHLCPEIGSSFFDVFVVLMPLSKGWYW